jgi:hypothetical protein
MMRLARTQLASTAASTAPSLAPNKSPPSWLGKPTVRISRASGAPKLPLQGPFTFDAWVRQRAVHAELGFEAWAKGKTDRPNPDLWKQLDARVYYRYGQAGDFQMKHVPLDGRRGNNAAYALNLRQLDPFAYPSKGPLPAAARPGADGRSTEVPVELFFWVNGKTLKDGQRNFRGTFAGESPSP